MFSSFPIVPDPDLLRDSCDFESDQDQDHQIPFKAELHGSQLPLSLIMHCANFPELEIVSLNVSPLEESFIEIDVINANSSLAIFSKHNAVTEGSLSRNISKIPDQNKN